MPGLASSRLVSTCFALVRLGLRLSCATLVLLPKVRPSVGGVKGESIGRCYVCICDGPEMTLYYAAALFVVVAVVQNISPFSLVCQTIKERGPCLRVGPVFSLSLLAHLQRSSHGSRG